LGVSRKLNKLMTKRVLSALIGAPLLLFITWLGGWYLAILVVGLALLALREFLKIGQLASFSQRPTIAVVYCCIWLTFFLCGQVEWLLPLGVLWLIIVFGWYALVYPKASFSEASYNFISLFYPVASFTFLYYLRELPEGIYWCFYVFLLVWITDTGAFFIGNAWGKNKLAPRVSPNKSVEGSIGGLIAALIFGIVFWFITKEGTLWTIMLLSVLTSAVSQIGDLFESSLKRMAGVKDSGKLIPGHGGILDRFDSFLFALPLVYFALVLGLVG
jgi:phosphatidate cytidylyltransferase